MVYSANSNATLPVAGSSSQGSSVSSNLNCPSSNGTSYTAANGAMFVIECGMDRAGNDLSMVHINSGQLQACMDICSSTSKCVDVSMSGSACYMKHDIGAHVVHNGVSGARLVQNTSNSGTSSYITDHISSSTSGASLSSLGTEMSASRSTVSISTSSVTNTSITSSALSISTRSASISTSISLSYTSVGGTDHNTSSTSPTISQTSTAVRISAFIKTSSDVILSQLVIPMAAWLSSHPSTHPMMAPVVRSARTNQTMVTGA